MSELAAPVLLRAEHVSRVYERGRVPAVTDVCLTIDRGEYVAITGPSGSGKSTLLGILGALDRPTTGEVYFEGRPFASLGDLDRFRSRVVGFVFQAFYLLPVLTARENVEIPMCETACRPRARRERAGRLLEQVGLGRRADHLPAQLSVGERQRVAIARALANDPVLLLADEPTGNLDSLSAEAVLDLFEHVQRAQGTTLVLVSHDPAVAGRADRVLSMKDGRLSA